MMAASSYIKSSSSCIILLFFPCFWSESIGEFRRIDEELYSTECERMERDEPKARHRSSFEARPFYSSISHSILHSSSYWLSWRGDETAVSIIFLISLNIRTFLFFPLFSFLEMAAVDLKLRYPSHWFEGGEELGKFCYIKEKRYLDKMADQLMRGKGHLTLFFLKYFNGRKFGWKSEWSTESIKIGSQPKRMKLLDF